MGQLQVLSPPEQGQQQQQQQQHHERLCSGRRCAGCRRLRGRATDSRRRGPTAARALSWLARAARSPTSTRPQCTPSRSVGKGPGGRDREGAGGELKRGGAHVVRCEALRGMRGQGQAAAQGEMQSEGGEISGRHSCSRSCTSRPSVRLLLQNSHPNPTNRPVMPLMMY